MSRMEVRVRVVLCAFLLTALTLPWWTAVADDAYITLAYGAEWASGGGLQHPSGERSEGFSSLVVDVPWAAAAVGRRSAHPPNPQPGGGTVVRGGVGGVPPAWVARTVSAEHALLTPRGMVG